MTKDEWLAWRRRGIGGSDAPILMGINPYRGPLSLYVDKMDRALDPSEPNEAAYWGTTLEDLVAKEFSRRTGFRVERPPSKVVVHPEYPWMIGTPDRYVYTEGQSAPLGILEVKTCSLRKEWDWDPDPPPGPVCQLQHYLEVTGATLGWLAVLIGGQRFMYHEVRRDDAFIREMVEKEREFWWYVENDVPPEPDGRDSTTAIINQRYSEARPLEAVELGDRRELQDAVELLMELVKGKQGREQEISRLQNVLKLALGSAEVGTINGHPVVSWKGSTRETIDTKLLRRDAPGVAEKFTRVSMIRTFRVHSRRRVDLERFDPEAEDEKDSGDDD